MKIERIHKIVFFSLLLFSSTFINAQNHLINEAISIKFQETPIDSALIRLEEKTTLNFTFNSSLIDASRKITAEFKDQSLYIILDHILNDPFLQYEVLENQLVIYRKIPAVIEQEDSISKELNEPLFISAFILDQEGKNPLPYASVGFLSHSIGTITNNDGYFQLNLDREYINDTLIIGYVGYLNTYIPVREVGTDSAISLEKSMVSLQEVIIRTNNPRQIIENSIRNIEANYISDPFMLRAFYRETFKKNEKYMVYTEGLVDIYKGPYRPSIFKDQINLLKQRVFSDVNSSDTVLFKLQGGLNTSLQLDIVKNDFNFFNIASMKWYDYSIEDMIPYNDQLAYIIRFKPKKMRIPPDPSEPLFEGVIYIESKTLTILKIDFRYTTNSLKRLSHAFIIRRSSKIKTQPHDVQYSLTYKAINGKYYLNHIRGSLKMKVRNKRHFSKSIYETTFELVSTDINYGEFARLKASEALPEKTIFSNIEHFYNVNYWNQSNFIFPEEDLLKALNRFNKEELKIQ